MGKLVISKDLLASLTFRVNWSLADSEHYMNAFPAEYEESDFEDFHAEARKLRALLTTLEQYEEVDDGKA